LKIFFKQRHQAGSSSPYRVVWLIGCAALMVHCHSVETESAAAPAKIRIEGTVFYPDETGLCYLVGPGQQIIGAGGINCTYEVEAGGVIEAHSGEGNTYLISSGGTFRGFANPATNCVVRYETGAIIEKTETGPGTSFVPL
jgi:hypothetical protein